MKLVFGKGKVSREEIEQQAANEIETLISSADGPPPIDWSVYGLSADVADPAVASAGLAASAMAVDDPADERNRHNGDTAAPKPAAHRRAATTTKVKAKAKPRVKATPKARAPKKTTA